MPTETIIWRGIHIEVAHGQAPVNRALHRFAVVEVRPPEAHLPLLTPRYGRYHYACRTEISVHDDFDPFLDLSWRYCVKRGRC